MGDWAGFNFFVWEKFVSTVIEEDCYFSCTAKLFFSKITFPQKSHECTLKLTD